MKTPKAFYALPVVLTSLVFSLLTLWPVDYTNVKVKSVIDGDTVELSNGRHVRYIGIDTPETKKNTKEGWVEVREPFGPEAKRFNEELVLGQKVRLEFDVQKEDKYNRLLAYCFVLRGGREVFVQAELIKNGLAYLYTFPPNIKYTDVLVEALREARSNKVGVWSVDLDIDSKDASRFLGSRKMVLGVISRSRTTNKTIRLSMDGLLLVIFKKDLGFFKDEGIDPARDYKGRRVKVFGLIKEYQGDPEIIVSNPWQIEVIE